MAEQKEESVSFRITYPAIYGRGAALRTAATIGGLSFEDYFIEWAEAAKLKEEGTIRWSGTPQLTVYNEAGKAFEVGQSMSLLRYVGKLAGLYPKSLLQRALVDECVDAWEDLASSVGPSIYEKDADKKKAMRQILQNETIPYW